MSSGGSFDDLALDYIVLGAGAVVHEYYVPALTQIGRIKNTWIFDPNPESVAALKKSFPDIRCEEGDPTHILSTARPHSEMRRSALIVVSPNITHKFLAARGLEDGFNVLCEKPLALTTKDCSELKNLAESFPRKLKVAMSRRYLPSLMLARDIIASGEYGPVKSIGVHDCTPFLWRPRSFSFFSSDAGGVLADMGVHYLDYLDTIVGPLEPVSYQDDARGGNESSLKYNLRAGPVMIEMRLSRIHQTGAYIDIICARVHILIDKSCENKIVVTPSGRPARNIAVDHPFDNPAWPANFHGSFCQMISDFERAVADQPSCIADATDAERTTALIEWAYSCRNGQGVVPRRSLPLQKGCQKDLVTGGTGFIGGH